jgi:outer membrane protein
MMTRRRQAAAAFVLIVFAAPAAAQEPPAPLVLTIDDAVQRALAHAPRVGEAAARVAAAEASTAARRASGRPTAELVTGYLRTNHVEDFGVPQAGGGLRIIFPDIPSNYRVRGEVRVPVFTAGRVDAVVGAAEAEQRAATADRRGAEADVRLEVTQVYWTLVTARESIAVLRRALERTDAWVGDVRSRVEAGLLPPNDVLSAQAQRARQSVRLIQAQNDEAAARMALARLIGVDLLQPIEPASPVGQAPASTADLPAQPAASLIARALERRTDREALVARRDSLELAAEAARAAIRPQVAALAALEPARPNPRFVPRMDEWRTSWDVGVTATWPIFDGGRSRAEAAAALAQAGAVTERLRDVDTLIALDVHQRLLDISSTRAAHSAADEGVAAATEAHRVVLERFRAGVATSTDVLDAELALLEAELERTRLAAALRIGEARLARAVGDLP